MSFFKMNPMGGLILQAGLQARTDASAGVVPKAEICAMNVAMLLAWVGEDKLELADLGEIGATGNTESLEKMMKEMGVNAPMQVAITVLHYFGYEVVKHTESPKERQKTKKAAT